MMKGDNDYVGIALLCLGIVVCTVIVTVCAVLLVREF
jgi:hypothetical protein